ncbi:MAG: pyridoxal-phosphate dependent enzyme [Anaerolineae bacterium]
MEEARRLAQAPNTYWTDQFNNQDAVRGYEQLGNELTIQVDARTDVFCASVGTAAMLMGVSRVLKSDNTRIVAFEPSSSPVLTAGTAGTHHVEGIGTSFVPPLFDPDSVDEVRTIDESDAREMARLLAREEGIFTGTSSGLNVVGALQLAQELGEGHTVVTVAVDSGLKYLAGDLYQF